MKNPSAQKANMMKANAMTAPALPTPKPGVMEIQPYAPGKSKAGDAAARLRKLSSNETPLGPSPKAIEAFKSAAASLHRYPEGSASALREAIAETYRLDAARIVCGAGSDELIGLLVHAYAGAGDEVLYSQHGFLMYKIYALGYGATPVTAPERELRADVDALLAAVTARTKLVFLANPNNPTGSYITAKELARLQAGLPPHVILAVDAAYAEYVEAEDYSDGMALASTTDNTVMLRTFSKIYGLSSLRLGWAYCPPHIADVLHRVRSPFNVSTPALEAGIAAVRDVAFTDATRRFNTAQRAALAEGLQALGLKLYPSEGNFLLVEFAAQGAHTAARANAFLMERGIIPREVGAYGLPNHLRISIGLEEDNHAVIDTLRAFLNS